MAAVASRMGINMVVDDQLLNCVLSKQYFSEGKIIFKKKSTKYTLWALEALSEFCL